MSPVRPPRLTGRIAAAALVGVAVLAGSGCAGSGQVLAGAAPQPRTSTVAPAVNPAADPVPGPPPSISLGNGFLSFPGPTQAWAAAHPDDPRTPLIKERIASQPANLWLTGNESFGNLDKAVRMSKTQDRTMLLTLWNIPQRYDGLTDPTTTTLAQYETWVRTVATSIGDTRAIVVLEPDALWFYDRLPNDNDRTIRRQALGYAISILKSRAPRTRVYLEAGTSSGSVTPARMAHLLHAVGITRAAGFAVNVSSFSPDGAIQNYAQSIRNALASENVPNARYVIDSGRNGAASWSYDWCNPSGQKLGLPPALRLGQYGLDMRLWVKAPGTSDGDCGEPGRGAHTYGGQFLPAVAYDMASN